MWCGTSINNLSTRTGPRRGATCALPVLAVNVNRLPGPATGDACRDLLAGRTPRVLICPTRTVGNVS
jgi:hypothetical protein